MDQTLSLIMSIYQTLPWYQYLYVHVGSNGQLKELYVMTKSIPMSMSILQDFRFLFANSCVYLIPDTYSKDFETIVNELKKKHVKVFIR